MPDLFDQGSVALPFHLPDMEGYHAAWNEEWVGFDIDIPGGSMFYCEQFFNASWTSRILEYLQENDTVDWRTVRWADKSSEEMAEIGFSNIVWKQDYFRMYGKLIPLPRLTSWYGDPGKSYTYSGIRSEPNEWNEGLRHIKERIERLSGSEFNSVLLNWYRDGQDSLSWHADDERELGPRPVIASANFGAERDFLLRRNSDPSQKLTIPLKNGTLLLMSGEMQQFWQHSIPKRVGIKGSRFNLTFRKIVEVDSSAVKKVRHREKRLQPAD